MRGLIGVGTFVKKRGHAYQAAHQLPRAAKEADARPDRRGHVRKEAWALMPWRNRRRARRWLPERVRAGPRWARRPLAVARASRYWGNRAGWFVALCRPPRRVPAHAAPARSSTGHTRGAACRSAP